MFVCYGNELAKVTSLLTELEKNCRANPQQKDREEIVRQVLAVVSPFCIGIELSAAVNRLTKIDLVLKGLSGDPTADLAQEIKFLRETIIDGMKERYNLVLRPGRYQYYENSKWFGDSLHEEFLPASSDMFAAAGCYAIEFPTASVFHSMRIAEYGLRLLARRLKVRIGKGRHLEYQDWGTVVGALKDRIAILRKKARSPKRASQLQLYSDLADQCAYFNDLWRTEVSHTRRSYKDPEALSVLERTRQFMVRLSEVLGKKP